MDNGIVNTVIAAAGTVVVALAALAANTFWVSRSFDQIDKRLGVIETDLKEFYRDMTKVKEKLGI